MILGYFFSIIVSVLFAVYAFPRKYSKQNVILYTLWMGIAYFIGTLILISVVWGVGFEKPENLLIPWHLLTVLRGLVWVFGMAAYNLAIDKIGLTRFNQWKNIQGPVGSVLILSVLTEVSGIKLLYLLIGIAIMFGSALFFQILTDKEKLNLKANKKNIRLGVVFALLSGVCFGVSALLNSVVSNQAIVGEKFTYSQLLYHSVSLIIFSILFYIIIGDRDNQIKGLSKRLKNIIKVDKKTILPVMAGLMFMAATMLTIYSYRLIPSVIAWSITQLNIFWTVIAGVFIFKEIDFKKHFIRLSCGVVMAILACVMLYLAV